MKRAFQLAWRYVRYHRYKSLLMVTCIVLTTLLPVALSLLLASFNRQLVARANATPLVVGAKGSPVDLVMHTLYFQTTAPGTIRWGEREEVGDYGLAIPLHTRISAQQIPVVGTSLEYFEFRDMGLAEGDGLIRLGDCVLGSRVAEQLQLKPGDTLLTDREDLFDIAGRYPLKMRVNGVLEPTRSPDDDVIFVDLKTVWVIEGYGHGHQDVEEVDDSLILESDDESVTASAAVLPYTEITDENIDSFHFHGSPNDFPITGLIVIPRDAKGEAILLSRFQRDDATAQMAEPTLVVEELMGLIFRVKQFFNANAILIGVSTALLLALVVLLSIRLREGEMETMFKIGCGRRTMAALVTAELVIVFFAAAICVAVGTWVIHANADYLVQGLMSRG